MMSASEQTGDRPIKSWPSFRPRAFQAGLIILMVGVATLLRWLLDPLLTDLSPFSTYYFAVAVAAVLGGFRVAMIAAVLCACTAHYLWVEPRHAMSVVNFNQFAQACVFVVETVLISGAVCAVQFLSRSQTHPE